MGHRRRIGNVAIDSPGIARDSTADSSADGSAQTMGLPTRDHWPAVVYEEGAFVEDAFKAGPQSHIRVLMMVVLFLSAVAVYLAIRPNSAALASGQVSDSTTDSDIVALSEATETSDASTGLAETGESSAGSEAVAGGIASFFTQEVRYWEPQILRWASEHGVDPNIVATIMQIESCGNPGAASYAGAQGLFQVMPFHFQDGENMLDPDTNARRGLAFFREQMRYTGGDVLLSFAGYNGGYAASGGVYGNWAAETQRYYYWAKGIYLDASSGATQSATLAEWLAAGGGGGCQIASTVLGI